jgi:hypothetical protein
LNSPAHFVFFALLAWALADLPRLAARPFVHQAGLILLVVLLLGGSIELTQPHFGRTGTWTDLGVNLLGACCGLLFLASGRTGLPWFALKVGQVLSLGFCATLFSGPAVTLWDMHQADRQFPVLSDFETRFEADRWTRGRIDSGTARHGTASLRVQLGTERFSGTAMYRSLGNWQGYSALALSIHNPDPEPLQVTVSIRDKEHDIRGGGYFDRYNHIFTIHPGWSDVTIPMATIRHAPAGRPLELDRLTSLAIFTMNLPHPRVIHVDHVRLIP